MITVADEELLPPPELFLHQSVIHGRAHVGRVMVHALRLVEATGLVEAVYPVWAAVYLHDIARRHDGGAPRHGADAWARLAQLPAVRDLLRRGGVRDEHFEAIKVAVTRHSNGEARPGEPHQRVIEFLKDADGLDRVRLGDLDPRYLRAPQARSMVGFAERLFEGTCSWPTASPGYFARLWDEAQRLLVRES